MGTPPNVTVTLTAEDRGVSSAISALTEQLQSLSAQQREVRASAEEAAEGEERFSESMHEARGAAALLGEEVGVRLNRHLRSVLASSQTLGPMLAAAFPVVAAIGFAEVIAHAAEKVSELASDLLIYTEDQKKAYELVAEFNKQLSEHLQTMARLNQEYERMGKSALQLADMDVRDLTKSLEEANKRIADTKKELTAPLPQAGWWTQVKAGITGFITSGGNVGAASASAATVGMESAQLERENAAKRAEETQEEITAQLRKAQKNRELAAQEARDKEDKERDEQNKKAIEDFVKRLEAEQKLVEDEKKLSEERAEFWTKAEASASEAETKQLEQRAEAEAKFRAEQQRNEQARQVDAIALQQRNVEQSGRQHDISGGSEASQLEALAQQKLAVEKAYIDAREKEITGRLEAETGEAYAHDLEEFSKLLDQKRAAEDRYLAESQKAKQIAADADPLRNVEKTIGKDIEHFFTDGIAHAKSFGDAMRGLAESVVSDLQKMAAQFLLTALKEQLFQNGGNGESGGGNGGILSFLGGLFSGAGGLAEGTGIVEGPGGPKSDIIPAMLSAGEAVLNADAVKALGPANIEALNRAARSPAMSGLAIPHFAEGGFAGEMSSSSSEIALGIGLDEGLILRHLGSKAAGKVILQQVANNPKGMQRALNRTDV